MKYRSLYCLFFLLFKYPSNRVCLCARLCCISSTWWTISQWRSMWWCISTHSPVNTTTWTRTFSRSSMTLWMPSKIYFCSITEILQTTHISCSVRPVLYECLRDDLTQFLAEIFFKTITPRLPDMEKLITVSYKYWFGDCWVFFFMSFLCRTVLSVSSNPNVQHMVSQSQATSLSWASCS